MKISVFEIEGWEKDRFECLGDEHEVRFDKRVLDGESVSDHADADVISTFIYSDVTPEALDRFDHLGMIATRSTGVDHIDLDWCREHDVVVANVPSYGDNTVAEHVFALLLAVSRHLVEAVDRTRRGDFSQAGLRGFDLQGRTIGIVGTGRIGAHVARIARGFGMEVLAFDRTEDPDLAREIGFEYVPMEELLRRADVVTLHVPGSPQTRHLLAGPEFERMKPGAVLINTSRGSVVESAALLRALGDGTVAAAGLDVVEGEPVIREEAELVRSVFSREHDLEMLLSDHVLLRMRNVIITPHIGFATREAVQRILDTSCQNIQAFARGEMQNVID
ncbi:MAG: hydroxyacid dehydrogenase [Candidatus Limnocylindrales bacterium]